MIIKNYPLLWICFGRSLLNCTEWQASTQILVMMIFHKTFQVALLCSANVVWPIIKIRQIIFINLLFKKLKVWFTRLATRVVEIMMQLKVLWRTLRSETLMRHPFKFVAKCMHNVCIFEIHETITTGLFWSSVSLSLCVVTCRCQAGWYGNYCTWTTDDIKIAIHLSCEHFPYICNFQYNFHRICAQWESFWRLKGLGQGESD